MSSYLMSDEEVSRNIDSNLLNYDDYYQEWDDAEETLCPDCKGTGLDRDEIYDCVTCFGEGYISETSLDTGIVHVVGSVQLS